MWSVTLSIDWVSRAIKSFMGFIEFVWVARRVAIDGLDIRLEAVSHHTCTIHWNENTGGESSCLSVEGMSSVRHQPVLSSQSFWRTCTGLIYLINVTTWCVCEAFQLPAHRISEWLWRCESFPHECKLSLRSCGELSCDFTPNLHNFLSKSFLVSCCPHLVTEPDFRLDILTTIFFLSLSLSLSLSLRKPF